MAYHTKELLGIISHAKEMLDTICKGFNTHNLESLKDIEDIGRKLHKESIDLTKSFLDEKTEDDINTLSPFLGI
ncbi:MAG: hypothetical protein ACE5KZ_11615 [Candidatus Scalinduaceae bacterium]